MNVLIALNSFKGSISAIDACTALRKGMAKQKAFSVIHLFPLCDGGDGSIEVLKQHIVLSVISASTHDALGKTLLADYLYDDTSHTAYIELAAASGLAILNSRKKSILQANTTGTGILINDAIRKGARKVILLVGGSATNDAGIGILSELGVIFLDQNKMPLKPVPSNLNQIRDMDDSHIQPLNKIKFEVWTDVRNPFDGELGAVSIYSKQKGANQQEQHLLEEGMIHFRTLILKKYKVDLNKIKGTGAAGGVGGGMVPILNAKIKHGTTEILKLTNFKNALSHYDLVITGEGSLDIQSGFGKLVQGVIKSAKHYKIPVIGVCGSNTLTITATRQIGFDAVFSLVSGPMSLDEAIKNAESLLETVGFNIGGLIKAVVK